MRNYYKLLNVGPASDSVAIRAAYRALIRKYHPDKFDGDRSHAERVSKSLNEAYAVLSDPRRRAGYDATLAAGRKRALKSGAASSSLARNRPSTKTRRRAVRVTRRQPAGKGASGARHFVAASSASMLVLGALYFLPRDKGAEPGAFPSNEYSAGAFTLTDGAPFGSPACCDGPVDDRPAIDAAAEWVETGSAGERTVDAVAQAADLSSEQAPQGLEARNSKLVVKPSPSPISQAQSASFRSGANFAAEEKAAAKRNRSPPAVADMPSRPVPQRSLARSAVVMGQQAPAEIAPEIHRQLQSCASRQVSPGAGANRIVTAINLRLNRDGSLARRPTIVRQTGLDEDNRHLAERVANLALAEFAGCSSLNGLPDELYEVPNGWRSVTFNYRFP